MGICCDFKRKPTQRENSRYKTASDQENDSRSLAYSKQKIKLGLNRTYTNINVLSQREEKRRYSLAKSPTPSNQKLRRSNTLKSKKVLELLGILYI